MGRLLRLAGFQPISYPSAEAFLADEKHPQFDCLLLDIRLGGMSGLELFRQLAAQKNHPPVIFITAFPERLLTGERPEPTFLITKPFMENTVKAAIGQAMFLGSTALPQA